MHKLLLPGLLLTLVLFRQASVAQVPAPSSEVAPKVHQQRAGESLPDLTTLQKLQFARGKDEFSRSFGVSNGLGPVFNENSCAKCHGQLQPVALPPLGGASIGLSMSNIRFGHLSSSGFDPLSNLGGSLLQSNSSSSNSICRETVPSSANTISKRIATATFGAGLVEQIPDSTLLQQTSNPQVSGRAHFVAALEDPAGAPLRVGRFGWKAQHASVLSFTSDASLNEMGLTNRFFANENAPQGNQSALPLCDTVTDPEVVSDSSGQDFLDYAAAFQRLLAPPPQTPRSGMNGEILFGQIGCANCHTPQFQTSSSLTTPQHLRDKSIRPYSDFLLHDMGQAADSIAQGSASPTEMRTAPLWGLKLRSFFWHDGSQPLTQVSHLNSIVLGNQSSTPIFYGHNAPGSEAASAAAAYANLNANQRNDLFRFLQSLGQAEFDFAAPWQHVGKEDLAGFKSCFASAANVTPEDICALADINQDRMVNSSDLQSLITAYQDPQIDCDCNQVNDLYESILLPQVDVNGDSYPDSCNIQLQVSLSPGWPLFPWEPLHRGQPAQIQVSGAQANDAVYLLISFKSQNGSSRGLLPSPFQTLCLNLPEMKNLSRLLGGPNALNANSSGSLQYSFVVPQTGGFGTARELRLQAVAIGNGVYRRSTVLTKELR
jgi:CxxC motif-containing protein (DUF1111 family)